jgi:hypothetical protein
MILGGLLIQGVEHGTMCGSSLRGDLRGDRIECVSGAARQEDGCSRAGEDTGDARAESARAAIDDRVLVSQ